MAIMILDTEYTTWPGALESGWAEDWQHREIVQIAAILLDRDLQEIAHLDQLVKPTVNPVLSDLFVDLTGITQSQVDSEGVDLAKATRRLAGFGGGSEFSPVICMNGDEAVFRENHALLGLELPFDRPWHRLRPFLEESGVDVETHSSGDLHRLTPVPLVGHTHNALHDVRSMAAWIRHAAVHGRLQRLDQLPTDLPTSDPRSGRSAGRP